MQPSFQLAASRSLSSNALSVSSVTSSSAVITWRRISVSSDLSDYYGYVIEYKEETSSTWQELLRRKHSESKSSTPSASLSGLTHNTEYNVRLRLYRVVRGNTDDTDSEKGAFKTKCIGKNAAFFAFLFKCLALGSARLRILSLSMFTLLWPT